MRHIERQGSGGAAGRSAGSAFGGLVWAVGDSEAADLGVVEQTRDALREIDETLAGLGSDRSRIVSATVYLADIALKAEMDRAWCGWIGGDPAA